MRNLWSKSRYNFLPFVGVQAFYRILDITYPIISACTTCTSGDDPSADGDITHVLSREPLVRLWNYSDLSRKIISVPRGYAGGEQIPESGDARLLSVETVFTVG